MHSIWGALAIAVISALPVAVPVVLVWRARRHWDDMP